MVEEAQSNVRTVTLEQPLVRGDKTFDAIQLRKPKAGELRGLSLQSLHQLDYSSLEVLLPRITIPTMTKQEVAELDTADFSQIGGEVLDFLLPKSLKAALLQQ